VHYARLTGLDCVAEDSGLEVDALNGAPGVYSARYAGVEGSREVRDAANNAKLLHALRGVPTEGRAARFVCAICLARPDGTVVVETSGTYEGVIAESPEGENGFGYDPLLYIPELGRTSAQLSPAEKNARSHRGAAARKLAEWLRREDGAWKGGG
jgi:XTP/dITP diphosphohydrolase